MSDEVSWADFIEIPEEFTRAREERGASSAEHKKDEKSEAADEAGASSAEQRKDEKSDALDEAGASSGAADSEEVEDSDALLELPTSSDAGIDSEILRFPVLDDETGRMYKVYEILMKKLGVEIPELRDENLSDLEKEMRQEKRNGMIIFEEEEGQEVVRSVKQNMAKAYIVCRFMTGLRIPIKMARAVPSSMPGITMTKVKFHSLEDKKKVMAMKEALIGTRYTVDHDLTRTEIHIQSQLLKLWKIKENRKNFQLNKRDRIFVNNRWVTVQPVTEKAKKRK